MADDNDNLDSKRDAILKAKEALEQIKASFEIQVEIQKVTSNLLRARYESLIQSGFEKSEALSIIIGRGLN